MRGGASVLRFALLAAFLVAVAGMLRLLDVGWEVVLPVMAVAWLIAAGVEWLTWTEEGSLRALPFRTRRLPPADPGRDAREEASVPPSEAPAPDAEPAPKPEKTAAPKTKKTAAPAKTKKAAGAKAKKAPAARAKKRAAKDGR